MSVFEKGLTTTLIANLVFVLLSIPLLLRKVRRNPIYGFRTRATLSDEFVWYEANAHFGLRFIVMSVISALATWLVYATAAVSPGAFLNLTLIAMLAPAVLAGLATARFIRTLDSSGPRAR
jgi:hypothetical protein